MKKTRGIWARARSGYHWEDHRREGKGLIFYVPDGVDKVSVASITVYSNSIEAIVYKPKLTNRFCKTLIAAKRWIERTAR